MTLEAEELTAIDLAIAKFGNDGNSFKNTSLIALHDKILALVLRNKALRLETDHEALLAAQGFVARHDPRPKIDEKTTALLGEAIKACQWIEIVYQSYKDPEPRTRKVAPLGLLSGVRVHLIALPEDHERPAIRTFRLDAISNVRLLDDSFERPADFDIHEFAAQSFS